MSQDPGIPLQTHLTGLDTDAWFERLEEIADDHGSYNFLGKAHAAAFIDAGPRLLVTFESAETIQAQSATAEPVGFAHVREDGWSHLGIYSESTSWYRDTKIYAYIDRLIDDGFFENFDDILFYGADGGGYAAAAYCVAAPGSRVLALRPQATLDPQITGFDPRYRAHRRLDFNSRYGYAPEMIEAASAAYLAFDPLQRLDAVHAALHTKPHVMPLRCTAFGQKLERNLDQLGVTPALRRTAMDGTLTQLSFAKLMRARRQNVLYLRRMLSWTETANRPLLAANVCAHAVRLGQKAVFAEKLQALQDAGHMPFRPVTIKAAE